MGLDSEKIHRDKQNRLMYIIIGITIIAIFISYLSTLQTTDEITNELAELKEESRQTNELIEEMIQNSTTSIDKLKESVDREFEVEHFQPIVNVQGGNINLKRILDWDDSFIEYDNITFSGVTNDHLEFKVKSAHLSFWSPCYFESKPEIIRPFGPNKITLVSNEKSVVLEQAIELRYAPLEQFMGINMQEIPENNFQYTVGSIYYEVEYTNLETGEKFQTNSGGSFSSNESKLMAYIPPESYEDFRTCAFTADFLIHEET